MVSMATPLHCGATKDSCNQEAKLCQGIGFCLFPPGRPQRHRCFLLPAPPYPQSHPKARVGSTWWDVIKVLWLLLQPKLPFRAPLHVFDYGCIPSKFPSERWGTHSCSSSEIQNVTVAVVSKPTKQLVYKAQYHLCGVQLHKAASSVQHNTTAVVYSTWIIPYYTAHIHSSNIQIHKLTPAVQHKTIAIVYSCIKIADARLSWLQQCLDYTLQELYFVALISFLQFTSPPPPDQPALRNGLCDWQIKHYYLSL